MTWLKCVVYHSKEYSINSAVVLDSPWGRDHDPLPDCFSEKSNWFSWVSPDLSAFHLERWASHCVVVSPLASPRSPVFAFHRVAVFVLLVLGTWTILQCY